MFCKQLLLMLLTDAVQVAVRAQGQSQINVILEAPQDAVVPVGHSVSFICQAVGNIFWQINGFQVHSEEDIANFAGINIIVGLSTPNVSIVNVTATAESTPVGNNNSMYECLVEEVGRLDIIGRSDPVFLTTYGEPFPPTDLVLTVPSQGLGVGLSWTPGFALEGEEITYVVMSEELSSGVVTESSTNIPEVNLQPPTTVPTCQMFNFTVYSVNGFGRSSTGINEATLIPTVPLSVESQNGNVSVSLQEVSASISFPDLSPCEEYVVTVYVLMFSEVANSMGVELSSPFNVSLVPSSDRVSLVLTAADGLQMGVQYDVIVFALNSAGYSTSNFTLSTVALLSSEVVVRDFTSVFLSCVFAAGSTALGCQASFGPMLLVNASLLQGATSEAVGEMVFSEELPHPLMVSVAEILSSGGVGSITIQPSLTILVSETTTTPTPDSTAPDSTTNVSKEESATSVASQIPVTPQDGSALSGNILYIIIGASMGLILFLPIITVVVICLIKHNHRKRHIHSLAVSTSEELKPNKMYGERGSQPHLTATTELGGLEGNASANGGEVHISPTYETIQAAKQEAAIFNPVYWPTGATPTSPHSPPCKAAPNPVYSETDTNAAAVGKPTVPPQHTLSDPPPPRYVYAYTSVATVNGESKPLSLKRADSASNPPPVPIYEELRSTQQPDTVGMVSTEVTKNESYGLLGVETHLSPQFSSTIINKNGQHS